MLYVINYLVNIVSYSFDISIFKRQILRRKDSFEVGNQKSVLCFQYTYTKKILNNNEKNCLQLLQLYKLCINYIKVFYHTSKNVRYIE